MKYIAFTQRVEISSNNEIRDCIDENWYNFSKKLKHSPLLIPNHNINNTRKLIDEIKPALIVLTGGNDLYKKNKSYNKNRNTIELLLLRIEIKKKIPLIGICRGMQLINHFFNGKITKINNHAGTQHKIFFEKKK